MKVGLVLGAGGVVGASWLIGALEALQSETGWDARSADHIVGTSAGSVIGSLLAAGLEPAVMGAYVGGGGLDEFAEAEEHVDEMGEQLTADAYRLERALPRLGPGSWRMAVSTLLRPTRHSPTAVLSGWLPRGFVSTKPIGELVERFVEDDWPDHPGYWAVAADYCSGRRVAFGREDAPRACVADAVAASCAIPAFYHPVGIGGRHYVDGGICSLSNLDLLRGRELDLVVCLNPTSSLEPGEGWSPGDFLARWMRTTSGRRLGHEARKLREEGTEVVILQPTADDLPVMGVNLMARDRRLDVLAHSVRTTTRDLRHRRDELRPLARAGGMQAPAARERRAA